MSINVATDSHKAASKILFVVSTLDFRLIILLKANNTKTLAAQYETSRMLFFNIKNSKLKCKIAKLFCLVSWFFLTIKSMIKMEKTTKKSSESFGVKFELERVFSFVYQKSSNPKAIKIVRMIKLIGLDFLNMPAIIRNIGLDNLNKNTP